MARISPTHGYYEEPRRKFPDWEGPTYNQLDYFRWHFQPTLPEKGWNKMNYRIKAPAKKMSFEKFKKIRRAYKNIPIEDRIEANKSQIRQGN